jgi:MFS transporter, DHA3 family, tetracycline resistance protein
MRRGNARATYYVMSDVGAFADVLMFTILAVYYVKTVHMHPLQLVLVGTVLEGTIVLFEIPTGVVADTVSRRLSVLIGHFLLGAGWVAQSIVHSFSAVLVTEAVLGIGYTFLSGATEAWIAGEAGDELVGPLFLRSAQVARVATLVAIPASVALASIRLDLPVLIGGVLYLGLGTFLALRMPEAHFSRAPREDRETWASLVRTLRAGVRVVRGRSLLVAVLAVGFIAGAASEGYDRLWEAHLLGGFRFPALGSLKPVAWFGVIRFSSTVLALVASHVTRRRMERMSAEPRSSLRLLIGLSLVSVAGLFVFGLAASFAIAVTAMLAKGLAGRLSAPLYDAWLVREIEPEVRATVFSMASFTDAAGQASFGPFVGYIGSAVSTGAAIVASGVMSLPNLGLFAWALRRQRPPRLESEPATVPARAARSTRTAEATPASP